MHHQMSGLTKPRSASLLGQASGDGVASCWTFAYTVKIEEESWE